MIIDSSAISALLLKEKKNYLKIAEIMKNENNYTLELMIKEVLNVAWKRCMKKQLDKEQFLLIYNNIKKLVNENVIKIIGQEKLLEEALIISVNHNLTVYDSLFIAAAKSKNEKLLTLNLKQKEVAKKVGVVTVEL